MRPITGWSTVAFALDWSRPPRQQPTTPFWYLATDQWRYETYGAEEFTSPAGNGALGERHTADCHALAARLGWLPSYPTFNRNPLDLADEAADAGVEVADHVVSELQSGRLRFACEDPDDPANFPRVLSLWRANLLGSSSKGHEYFLRHLLGVPDAAVRGDESAPEHRPGEVEWRDEAPIGKLDLFTTVDFRMNGSCLYSDVVLPAATWYEKHDISSTDLHPFVHPFNAAIPPPWETRTDWDAFNMIAAEFSRLAETHLGTRTDIVAAPLLHDTPGRARPAARRGPRLEGGRVRAGPGQDDAEAGRWSSATTRRSRRRCTALGPLVENAGIGAKGVSWKPAPEVAELARRNGRSNGGGPADGRPVAAPRTSTSARRSWRCRVRPTAGSRSRASARSSHRPGSSSPHVPEERADERLTFGEIDVQPRKVIASAEWSGLESRERRYSPFTANVELLIPWRTLTGRQQLFLDHDWMLDLGEGLPAYRPPVDAGQLVGARRQARPPATASRSRSAT